MGRDARIARRSHPAGAGREHLSRAPERCNFEYLGEDPFLAGQIDVGYIQGVQSQGVGTCVKHYVCNNQETQRNEVDVRIGRAHAARNLSAGV